MAFIKLLSSNPDFSHVIQKNPQTQIDSCEPFTRNLTAGRVSLWFEDPALANEAIVVYRQFENRKSKDFSYLDYSAYSSGQIYIQMINAILRSAFNVGHEKDTHEAILQFNIYNKLEKDFQTFFPGKIKECVTKDRHSLVTIVGSSVQEVLQICSCISLYSFLHDPDVFIEEPQFKGNLKNLVNLTNSYPILRNYVSAIRSPRLLSEVQEFLDQTPYKFTLDKSYEARKNFYVASVESLGDNRSKILIDLGCGEGGYFKLHSRLYPTVEAVELDPIVYNDAFHSVRKIQQEDMFKLFNTSIQVYLDKKENLKNCDVLITEVLEHISYNESVDVLTTVVEKDPNSIIMTMPNRSFNIHYGMEEGTMRHDDHLWEPDLTELKYFLEKVKGLFDNYDVKISYLGDALRADPTVCSSFGIFAIRKGS